MLMSSIKWHTEEFPSPFRGGGKVYITMINKVILTGRLVLPSPFEVDRFISDRCKESRATNLWFPSPREVDRFISCSW